MTPKDAIFRNSALTDDADPNVTPPAVGSPSMLDTPDWYHPGGGGSALILTTQGTTADAATVTIYVYSTQLANQGISPWVPWQSALTVVYGTAQFVKLPPYHRIFIRVTGKTGAPTALLGFWGFS